MEAIVYTTNTGSSKAYANMLSRALGIPTYTIDEAKSELPAGAPVIYVGWVMASSVKGYKKAAKLFNIAALCAVGMGKTGADSAAVRSKTHVDDRIPVFMLQGNFDINKLGGIYKPMMKIMLKALSGKADKTDEEKEMLEILTDCKNKVVFENLSQILKWYMEIMK